jgi:REP element-mobilizing transposase RayT
VEGGVHYVISRASQDEVIFKDKDDYKMYMDLVSKYKSQHKFKLFAYCLLPDRIEMLVETGEDASISEIMHDLNSLYTKYFNGRYQKRGHLFESRFRSVLVEKATSLVKLTQHIHRAPMRHDITKDQQISSYPYSSYQLYALGETLEAKEVLSFLNAKDDASAYEKYVIEPGKEEIEELTKALKRGSVYGSDEFLDRVKKRVEERSEVLKEEAKPSVKSSATLLVFISGLVVVAIGATIYLYVSKQNLESKYQTLLNQREAEFAEKTKFENRSPLALSELDGTAWAIEMIGVSGQSARKTMTDTIRFENGKIYTDELKKRGFNATNFSVSQGQGGMTTWETVQSNAEGETISWRGDWQGDAMKGVMSSSVQGDFSFYSMSWAYAGEGQAI